MIASMPKISNAVLLAGSQSKNYRNAPAGFADGEWIVHTTILKTAT